MNVSKAPPKDSFNPIKMRFDRIFSQRDEDENAALIRASRGSKLRRLEVLIRLGKTAFPCSWGELFEVFFHDPLGLPRIGFSF